MNNPFKTTAPLGIFLAVMLAAPATFANTYYWDNNGTTAGFGTAGGTWAAPTVSLWSTDGTGVATPGSSITTATTDALNFGNGSTGLAAGTVTVSGSVSAGNITYASGSGAIVLSGGTGIGLASPSTITLNNSADTISTPITSGALTLAGSGTLTLSGANTYSGATTVNQGTLAFSGSGSIANSALNHGVAGSGNLTFLTVTPASSGGTVARSGGYVFNGLCNAQDNGASGFNFTVNGATAANNVEQFGALTLNSGSLEGNIIPNSSYNVQVDFSSVTRNPGTVLYFGRNDNNTSGKLGATTIANASAGYANLVFTTAPTLSGNGGAAGSTTLSILPWANVVQGLATYDSTYGLRALASGEYATLASGMTAGQNAKVSTATTTISANTTINSLSCISSTSGITISPDTTELIDSSGAICGNNPLTIGSGSAGGNGILEFNSAEGIIFVENTRTLTINSVIDGSGGLTVHINNYNGSTGNLLLNGANTFSGVTALLCNQSADVVHLGNSLALQNSTLDYNNYGSSFTFGASSSTALTAFTFGGLKGAQNISLANINSTPAAVTLTIGSSGDTDTAYTYSGVLSGSSGNLVTAGPQTLTLSGANTYTGTTTVENGALVAGAAAPSGSAGAFGNATSAIALGDATSIGSASAMNPQLLNGGAFTMARTVTVGANNNSLGNASTTFALGGSTANSSTFSGAITVNQSLIVTQATGGTLNLTAGITSGSSGTQTVTVNNPGAVNVSTTGIGGGTGTIALTKSGAGTLNLSVANTYTGGTTISAGTLQLGVANAIPGNSYAGDVTVNGTLDLNSYSEALNGLNGSGTVDTTAASSTPTLTVGANGDSGSYSGVIQNSGSSSSLSLTKSGSGTQTLSGNNTYSGVTTVSVGTLKVGSSTALGNGSATIGASGTLDLNGQTIANAISTITAGGVLTNSSGSAATVSTALGSSSASQLGNFTVGTVGNIALSDVFGAQFSCTITKTGTGTLSLGGTGVNGVSGNPLQLAVNGGTVVLAKTGTGAAADGVTVNNGGVLQMDPAHTTSGWQSWAGQMNSGPTLSGGTFDLNGTSGQNNRFQQLQGTSGLITNSSTTPAEIQISARNSTAYTFSGNIVDGPSGSQVSLTYTNAGTTGSGRVNILAGNNTFSGNTMVGFGTLELGSANAAQNSTINLAAGSGLGSNPSLFEFAGGITTFTIGGLSGSQNFALTDVGSSAITLSIGNNNSSPTYSGAMSGGGGITKIGSGALTLSGASTYSGGTTLSAGQLNLNYGGSSSANSAIGTGTLTISGGAIDNTGSGDVTLQPNNAQKWNGDFTYAGSLHNLNLGTGAVTLGANRRVTVSANTLTVGGIMGDSGYNYSLNKTGGGTLELSGANTFTGGMTIQNGIVQSDNPSSLGTGTVTLGDGTSANYATLQASPTSSFTNANAITVASSGSGIYAIQNLNSSDYNLSGNVALNNGLTLRTTSSGALFVRGAITSGGSNPLLTIDGGGTTTKFVGLYGNNSSTFTGNIVVTNKGDVKTGGSANSLSSATTVSLDSTSIFDNGSLNQTIAGLNNYGAGGGTVTDAGSGVSITLGGSGSYSFSGVINNVGGIVKTGTGMQVLSGANTYSGATSVSNGTLLVNGALGGVGAVTVNGGTLGGSGGINGAVTIGSASGGTLSPGSAGLGTIGTLTFSNTLTLGSSATVNMEINKASGPVYTSDKAAVTGAVTYGGTLNVISNANSSAFAAGDSFTLFSGGSFSGWFSSVSVPALAGGISWDTNKLASTGVLDIYSFTTTTLTLHTPANTTAVVAAAKLNNHVSSSRASAAYPTGWTNIVTTAPANGTASVDGSGNLNYIPNSGYSGSDSFTCTLRDGHGWQTMAVSVTVGSGNGTSANVISQGIVGSNYVINFAGIPGYTYTVETNSVVNGPGWIKWGNISAGSNGAMQVIDPLGGGSLFYRTVWPSY